MNPRTKNRVFYVIVVAQFFGTSLWFAGNAILPQLQLTFNWPSTSLGYLTSAIQLGFILGTLTFAIFGLADKFSPSRIFFLSCLAAGAANLFSLVDISSVELMISTRFAVGFFLAGIYPIGMKIASDWKAEGLGHWLGALVGALVLGTAFPHCLKLIPELVSPGKLLIAISALCGTGGLLLFVVVPDGPYRKKSSSFTFLALQKVFRMPSFRSPAFGYFGHMWELYAFWAFVPWIVGRYAASHALPLNESLLSFLIIGSGAVGCIVGGITSTRVGSAHVARFALVCSGLCCLFSPMLWMLMPAVFIGVMIFWGIMAAADSPQFSALVARHAPDEFRGSAITLVICVGFSITIGSIQLLNYLQYMVPYQYLLLILTPGPILGVMAFNRSFLLNKT